MAKAAEQEQIKTEEQEEPKATDSAEPKEETKVVPINKPSTYKSKVSNKVQEFNAMYSHEWDFDVIDRLEKLKISLKLGEISEDEYMELAGPLLAMGG